MQSVGCVCPCAFWDNDFGITIFDVDIASTALVPLQRLRLRRSLFAQYSAAADIVAATASATVTPQQHYDVSVTSHPSPTADKFHASLLRLMIYRFIEASRAVSLHTLLLVSHDVL